VLTTFGDTNESTAAVFSAAAVVTSIPVPADTATMLSLTDTQNNFMLHVRRQIKLNFLRYKCMYKYMYMAVYNGNLTQFTFITSSVNYLVLITAIIIL